MYLTEPESRSAGRPSERLGAMRGELGGSVAWLSPRRAGACRLAASAARHHAVELEEARAAAKAAVRDAVDANGELSRQRKVAAGAHADRRVAEGRATEAAQRGSSARAAGPAGAGVATVADGEESSARGEATAAGEVAERAERRAADAGESLDDARRKGRRANEEAEEVGEKAAEVYREVAGRARPPVLGISPAAPVSLRGASPTLAALGPFAGGPFRPLGRYATPAQARAGQIAALRALAEDRERALEGGAADRFGGEFKGYTGFHLFGDPDTRGYDIGQKAGELASWFPGPGLVRNIAREGGERGLRKFAKEGGESVRDRVAREARSYRDQAGSTYWLRKSLGKAPKDGGPYAAHHLVPKGAYSRRSAAARKELEEAQARMARLGIGPDEAANGVYLPPSVHKNTFGNDYFEAINRRLGDIDEASPSATDDAKRELGEIAREIAQGTFP